MGLYKEESRIGSAGFLKVENREGDGRLHLKIQNIPHSISGRFPIRVYDGDGWKEIDGIAVREGRGSWEENLTKPADKVILKVMLPSGYYLEGRSRTASEESGQGKTESAVRESVLRESGSVSEPSVPREVNPVSEPDVPREVNLVSEPGALREVNLVSEPDVPRKVNPVSEPNVPREVNPVSNPSVPKEVNIVSESSMSEGRNPVKEPEAAREVNLVRRPDKREKILIKEELLPRTSDDKMSAQQNIPQYNLKEDKWEQILDTYENIHPYGDERVYVKLEPKDFVILQSKYQHLVNNSFLLHGFYNYRYVILGKEQDYYLGVPGVFYEREKMVALMFGFEAFECPGGNVRAGEFGYYLRKVEL
ncbi:MAG: hypothetical protein K2L82_04230 [Lachnospiraceae bacterium]|nr:hypothetical protein [Lachnospiraceae bacterium]